VPHLQCNLFSVKQLAQAGGTFCINGTTATLYNSCKKTIASCTLNNDVYILGHSISSEPKIPAQSNDNLIKDEQALSLTNSNMISQWHKRLGHILFTFIRINK